MSKLKYPGIVRAARNIGQEKKALAEALYLAIPPRRGRPVSGTATIDEQLQEAADEIERETGEVYAADTLSQCRLVAAWVAAGNGGVHASITWADASWTAHREAYKKGISWADFVAGKRAVRQQTEASQAETIPKQASEARAQAPQAPGAITSALDDEQFRAKVVASMDYEQRRKLSNEITDQEMARIEERRRREGVKDVALLPEQINAKEHREGHRRISDKLRQILFLIQEVNHDWAEFEGTFHLEMVQLTIDQLKVELGLLEFYADLTVDGDDPRVVE